MAIIATKPDFLSTFSKTQELASVSESSFDGAESVQFEWPVDNPAAQLFPKLEADGSDCFITNRPPVSIIDGMPAIELPLSPKAASSESSAQNSESELGLPVPPEAIVPDPNSPICLEKEERARKALKAFVARFEESECIAGVMRDPAFKQAENASIFIAPNRNSPTRCQDVVRQALEFLKRLDEKYRETPVKPEHQPNYRNPEAESRSMRNKEIVVVRRSSRIASTSQLALESIGPQEEDASDASNADAGVVSVLPEKLQSPPLEPSPAVFVRSIVLKSTSGFAELPPSVRTMLEEQGIRPIGRPVMPSSGESKKRKRAV